MGVLHKKYKESRTRSQGSDRVNIPDQTGPIPNVLFGSFTHQNKE